MNISQMSFGDLAKTYGIEANTLDFLGHAIALYTDNSFITKNCVEVIEKI
jgi:Rab GDP dissociation inhibitor